MLQYSVQCSILYSAVFCISAVLLYSAVFCAVQSVVLECSTVQYVLCSAILYFWQFILVTGRGSDTFDAIIVDCLGFMSGSWLCDGSWLYVSSCASAGSLFLNYWLKL